MSMRLQARAEAYSAGISHYKEKIRVVQIVSGQIADLVDTLDTPDISAEERAEILIRLKALCAMIAPVRPTQPPARRTLFSAQGPEASGQP